MTERDYLVARRKRIPYEDPWIAEFARFFGQPDLQLTIDPQTRTISSAVVVRDAVCGCARYVAERLVGISADDGEAQAGMLHHHFPCWAAMGVIPDYYDTLMHVSGNIMIEAVGEQIKPYKKIQYIAPGWRSDDPPSKPGEGS